MHFSAETFNFRLSNLAKTPFISAAATNSREGKALPASWPPLVLARFPSSFSHNQLTPACIRRCQISAVACICVSGRAYCRSPSGARYSPGLRADPV